MLRTARISLTVLQNVLSDAHGYEKIGCGTDN